MTSGCNPRRPLAAALGLAIVAAAAICAAGQSALAQSYPNRPIKVIVPYPPGGTPDVLVRTMSQAFQERTGQALVVENKPGGATVVGAAACREAPPDGYTLCMLSNSTISNNAVLFKKLPYQPDRDFEPILQLVANTVLVLHKSVPANNLKELVEYSQKNPDKLYYGHFGAGGDSQLFIEWLRNKAGLKVTAVPFRGAADLTLAFEGGQVQMMYLVVGSGGIYHRIKAGDAKGLLAAGDKRSRQLPDVPSFSEAGFQTVRARTWFGIFGPAGMPKEAIAKIHSEFTTIMKQPAFQEKVLFTGGLELVDASPDAFKTLLVEDRKVAQELIEASGVTVEQP